MMHVVVVSVDGEAFSCCGGEAYRGSFASAAAVRFCCALLLWQQHMWFAAGISAQCSGKEYMAPCHSPMHRELRL